MIVMKTKKTQGTKKCVINRKLKSEDYEHCLEAKNNILISKSQQVFRTEKQRIN